VPRNALERHASNLNETPGQGALAAKMELASNDKL
jgi:hypothetical protein